MYLLIVNSTVKENIVRRSLDIIKDPSTCISEKMKTSSIASSEDLFVFSDHWCVVIKKAFPTAYVGEYIILQRLLLRYTQRFTYLTYLANFIFINSVKRLFKK